VAFPHQDSPIAARAGIAPGRAVCVDDDGFLLHGVCLFSFIPFYPFDQGHGNIPDDQEYNEEEGENNNPFGDSGIHSC
jgi:hypothetical protein